MGNIGYKIDADADKFIKEMSRTVAKQEESIQKLKQMNRQGKKTKGSMEKMGISAVGQFVSIAAAIGVAKEALTSFDKAATAAQASADSAIQGRKAFGQISQNDADRAANQATADNLRRGLGLSAREAQDTAFIGSSLGLSAEDIQATSRSTFLDIPPSQLLSSIAALQAQFGVKETGSAANITNKLLAATGITKELVGPFSEAVAQVAPTLVIAGATDEEALAATSTVALGGNLQQQRTKLKATFAELNRKKEFQGTSFQEKIDNLVSRFGQGDEVDTVGLQNEFTGIEAVEGAVFFLKNQDKYKEALRKIKAAQETTGTDRSLFESRIRGSLNDPLVRSKVARDRATQVKELSGEEAAINENIQDAFIALADSALVLSQGRGKIGGLGVIAANARLGLNDAISSDLEGTAGLVRNLIVNSAGISPNTRDPQEQAILNAFNELVELTKKQLALSEKTDQARNAANQRPQPTE